MTNEQLKELIVRRLTRKHLESFQIQDVIDILSTATDQQGNRFMDLLIVENDTDAIKHLRTGIKSKAQSLAEIEADNMINSGTVSLQDLIRLIG